MEYGKIIAVTGLSGLFELLTSKNDGAIVRSLEDNNTRFVATRVHNFSQLESIEVFTTRENVNLVEVFQAIEKNSAALPDVKNSTALKAYFTAVFPQLDQERVYTSDMKKMIKWYELLKKNSVEFKLTPLEAENAEQDVQDTVETEEAPKKTSKAQKSTVAEDAAPKAGKAKATTEKTAAPKAKATPATDEKEAPKKKAPAKKKKTDE